MIRNKFVLGSLAFGLLMAASSVVAAPLTLEGMGQIKTWVDSETTSGEMPGFVWGTSDTDGADRIGLFVEFADGLTGSATWDGVSSVWNSVFGGGLPSTSSTGFMATFAVIHFLFNTAVTTTGSAQLPLAWTNSVMPFSNNFDLDYVNRNNSHFRASVAGWESATFTTYSSSAIPEPGSIALLGLGLLGLGGASYRRRKAAA